EEYPDIRQYEPSRWHTDISRARYLSTSTINEGLRWMSATLTRSEHLLAISFIGVGALVLIYQQQNTLGIALLTMLAGYAYGASVNGVVSQAGTSQPKQSVALIA